MIVADRESKEYDIFNVGIRVYYGSCVTGSYVSYAVVGDYKREYHGISQVLIDSFDTVDEAIALHSTLDALLEAEKAERLQESGTSFAELPEEVANAQ